MNTLTKEIIQSDPIVAGRVLFRHKYKKNSPPEIEEVVVSKVGKKYFYLKGWEERYPIGKENLLYQSKEYSQNNFQLYRTRQEILDLLERSKLLEILCKHFQWSGNSVNITLDQLRSAVEVLGLTESDSL